MTIFRIMPIIILIIMILSILNFLVIPRRLQVYVISLLVSMGMLVHLVLYHLTPSTPIYSSVYSLSLAGVWLLNYIISYHAATKTMGKDTIVINLTSVWVIAVIIGIFLDASHLYIRLGLNEDIAFWFFSAILQGFSALLGIVAAFSLIRFQVSQATIKIKSFQKIIESFFPAIIHIIIVLAISIVCLPFSRVLSVEKYQSALATIIVVVVLFSITAIVSLFKSLFKIIQTE